MTLRLFLPMDSGAVSAGADTVADAVLGHAERHKLDIELVRTGSRGLYWLEPLLEVATGKGRIGFGPLETEQVADLMERLKAGEEEAADHPSCLGVVEELPYLKEQQRLIFSRCGVTDPFSLPDFFAHGGFDGFRAALQMSPDQVVDAVIESNLRGRGGAGFPTGIKMKTVAAQAGPEKHVCCNGDEGDSGTFADRMLMEGDPFSLVEGMLIAAWACGAEKGLIYVRSEYPAAISALKRAVDLLRKEGWLGTDIQGSGFSFDVEIRRGAGAYICGEESAMLESLEGKRGQVRAKPPIPAICGLKGRPTLVNNVLTLASLPFILVRGSAAYRTFGHDASAGTQAFQLSGNVRRAGLVEVGFGVTLARLIEGFGGGTRSGKPVKCVQVGGPLGAYLTPDRFDCPMDYESLAARGGMLGHGGIVVFDTDADMAQMARFAFEFCAIESCGKCTPCRIGAVRGMETMDRLLHGDEPEESARLIRDLCEVMESGSLCAMGGLTPQPVLSALNLFPAEFGLPADQGAAGVEKGR